MPLEKSLGFPANKHDNRDMMLPMILMIHLSLAQDLFTTPIRKLMKDKTSSFHSQGIFHYGENPNPPSSLKSLRFSYSQGRGFERIVFDLESKEMPRIYGYFSNRKLYLDFFNTILTDNINAAGNSRYIDTVNYYPWGKESLSVEITFKEEVMFDIFYLESPHRLVLDIKN